MIKILFQIVAICGKNKKEYAKIQKYIKNKKNTNIRLEGFCSQLELYFSACDLAFTRGGSLSLTEPPDYLVVLYRKKRNTEKYKFSVFLFLNIL